MGQFWIQNVVLKFKDPSSCLINQLLISSIGHQSTVQSFQGEVPHFLSPSFFFLSEEKQNSNRDTSTYPSQQVPFDFPFWISQDFKFLFFHLPIDIPYLYPFPQSATSTTGILKELLSNYLAFLINMVNVLIFLRLFGETLYCTLGRTYSSVFSFGSV